MGKHSLFILFSYGVTALAIVAVIAYTVIDYRRLTKALGQFPPREGDNRE